MLPRDEYLLHAHIKLGVVKWNTCEYAVFFLLLLYYIAVYVRYKPFRGGFCKVKLLIHLVSVCVCARAYQLHIKRDTADSVSICPVEWINYIWVRTHCIVDIYKSLGDGEWLQYKYIYTVFNPDMCQSKCLHLFAFQIERAHKEKWICGFI